MFEVIFWHKRCVLWAGLAVCYESGVVQNVSQAQSTLDVHMQRKQIEPV